MCRQFIREFSDGSVPIFMYGKDEGECVVKTLGEVCCGVFYFHYYHCYYCSASYFMGGSLPETSGGGNG